MAPEGAYSGRAPSAHSLRLSNAVARARAIRSTFGPGL